MNKPLVRDLLALVLGALVVSNTGCVEQTEEKPTEDDLKTVRQNLLPSPPSPKLVVNADLDGKVVYLGMDPEHETVEPGKDFKLVHYWKVISPPGDGWRIFTHLFGTNKQGFINVDHGPIRGKYPVSQWKAGDIIRDEHTVRLPGNWRFDKMEIYTGLWRGPDRMPVKSGPKDSENRILAASIPVGASKPVAARKKYVVRHATAPIKLDGKLDEKDWAQAPSTGAFTNTMTGAAVDQATEAKLLWDDKNLYVSFVATDEDVWTDFGKHDDELWKQEAVELFIDADGDGKTYVELQVAPNGTTFDTYLPTYRTYEDTIEGSKLKKYSWTSKMKVKAVVDGTLNKRKDKDKSWTVEMAIPLEDVKGLSKAVTPKLPPSPGDTWRINMFRLDSPDGKPQQASAWSPPMVGDFHALDKFGELVFADDKGQVVPPSIVSTDKAAEKGAKGKGEEKAGGKAPKKAAEK